MNIYLRNIVGDFKADHTRIPSTYNSWVSW